MTIPVWFLDIDGVINALSDPTPEGYCFTMAQSMGHDWPICWRSEVVDFVNEASRDGRAEIRWLTTWAQDARTNPAPALGFDEFFAYDMPDDSPGWWKEFVVADFIATSTRPFIWTDDDIPPADIDYVRGEVDEVSSLLVAPSIAAGLSSTDLRAINEFLRHTATTCPVPQTFRPIVDSVQQAEEVDGGTR